MPRKPTRLLTVGVDTGGTFTDIVFRDGGEEGRLKVLSTPHDPAEAVLAGFAKLFGERRPDLFTYGTTVATNAMLERHGARTALVTTAGFEDVIEIGRQARPHLYDLEPQRPEPLVPPALRLGVRERALHDGKVLVALDEAEIRHIAAGVRALGVEAIAVCFLHSPVAPRHESAMGKALAVLGLPVTLSHRLSPTTGEYERTSTTVANAYVQPKVAGHIRSLASKSRARRVRVMQSSGGAVGAETAAREPVRTMLSGPAGGVAAAAAIARRHGIARMVTLDMGGTSTDVAFVVGEPPRRADTWIGGMALRVPCLDIHTVGAGGGSIARVDEGGALRVGPESAGADPGPACYGRGEAVTVTDANVVLGRLPAAHFLGGTMRLDLARARLALEKLRRQMGARSVEEAAEGVVRVVEGNMERAIRTITVERGQDPRSAVLLPFGGAAGLHACGLADEVGFREVLVPRHPGLLSAIGILDGRVVIDRLVPLAAFDPTVAWLSGRAAAAAVRIRRELAREGLNGSSVSVRTLVRARYERQSIELEIPLTKDLRRRFDDEHRARFHSADPARRIEVVGLRVSGVGDEGATGRSPSAASPAKARRSRPRPLASVAVFFAGKPRTTAIYERSVLAGGACIQGPAVVVEYSSTTVVAPGWTATVDEDANLRLAQN
jgi:N-methylhydantoinase A